MWWTKFHLRKPLSSIIFYCIIMVIGLFCLPGLRFTVSPESYSPIISIKTQYFGMDSKYIEKNITIPIENAISSIKGVLNISSVSEEGQSIVTVKMNNNRPIKMATLEIKSAVDTVRESFPGDVQEPVISHYDPSQMPVMIISYYPGKDNISLKDVRRFVEQKVKPMMQKVEGVAECVVTGGRQKEIGVFVNTERLYSTGLQLSDINRSVQINNISTYLGNIEYNDNKVPVFSVGKYLAMEDIQKIAILGANSNAGRLMELDKLATVEDHHKRIDTISRINGIERVSLYIQKRSDGNIRQICADVKSNLKKAEIEGVKYETDFDKSDEINESLANLVVSILLGLVLLAVIMFLFIGDIRKSLVTVIPLPISLSVTFIAAAAFNIELNSMIMSGIAMGSGMLVNSGIIVVEFLNKKRKKSLDYHILKNIKELRQPLLASLLTHICVFLPILLTSPDIRYLYLGFAVFITIMLVMAFLLSIGLVPLVYKLWCPEETDMKGHALGRFLFKMEYRYVQFLKKLGKHKALLMRLTVLAVAFAFVMIAVKGKGLSSPGFIKEIYAYAEPPTGTSLGDTDDRTRAIEDILQKEPGVKKIISKVEKAHSTIIIRLSGDVSEKKADALIDGYKKKLAQSGTFIYFTYGDQDSNNKEINVMFVGNNLNTIRDLCRQASRKLYSTPDFSDLILRFKDDNPQYLLKPDLRKALISGVSVQDIVNEARSYLYGIISSKLNPENEGQTDIKINAALSAEEKATLDNFLSIKMRSKSGGMIPLRELLIVNKGEASSKVYRHNKRRNYTITARLKSGISLSAGMAAIKNELDGMKLPEGYYWQFDEKYEELNKNTQSMVWAVLFAVYLTFVTLVVSFEGFRKAALTLLVIPLSFIGIAFALYVFGMNLSTPVYIGLIILAGITVNNSVLILSDMKEKWGRIKVFHSAREKLNSIVLTSLTSITGLVPLIFAGGSGQYLWRPFSITVVFGLLASTALCVALVPIAALGKKTDELPPNLDYPEEGLEK